MCHIHSMLDGHYVLKRKIQQRRSGKGGAVFDGVARESFLEKVVFCFGCLGLWGSRGMGSDC